MTAPRLEAHPKAQQRYAAAWRWHFFAGVFVVPFLLVLATTGLVMVYYSTVQTPLGEQLQVDAGSRTASPPGQQLAAAMAALPEATVTLYIPAPGAERTAQFELTQADSTFVVDIDPYSNAVLRVVDKERTWYALAHRIHGTLLLGDVGDLVLEVVAGLGLLLVATGLYMWLQRRQTDPASTPTTRLRWRRWHLLTGLNGTIVLCFFLLSGQAWSRHPCPRRSRAAIPPQRKRTPGLTWTRWTGWRAQSGSVHATASTCPRVKRASTPSTAPP